MVEIDWTHLILRVSPVVFLLHPWQTGTGNSLLHLICLSDFILDIDCPSSSLDNFHSFYHFNFFMIDSYPKAFKLFMVLFIVDVSFICSHWIKSILIRRKRLPTWSISRTRLFQMHRSHSKQDTILMDNVLMGKGKISFSSNTSRVICLDKLCSIVKRAYEEKKIPIPYPAANKQLQDRLKAFVSRGSDLLPFPLVTTLPRRHEQSTSTDVWQSEF